MEIEKKFIVNKERLLSTVHLEDCSKEKIEQVYLSVEDNEIRIRKITDFHGEDKHYMTIKSTGDLIREEVEFEIPLETFKSLVERNMFKGRVIEKLRYIIPIAQNLKAEVDFYEKNLEGLIIAEVEFESIEQAELFSKPEWFDEEVTYQRAYKNKNLALSGKSAKEISN